MTALTESTEKRHRARTAGGILVLLSGAAILFLGLPDWLSFERPQFAYEKQIELKPGEAGFPALESRYAAHNIERLSVVGAHGGNFVLNVAHFDDERGAGRRAILFLPEERDGEFAQPAGDDNRLRFELWQAAAQMITRAASEQALFLAWWDNAQRIRFFTGNKTWVDAPIAAAFADAGQREFWARVSGGFSADKAPLTRLADWLTMDAERALAEIASALPEAEIHFLVCIDDLARLAEISALSGRSLPFETRVFPGTDNIHTLIARVKGWAREKGQGSYLVQHLPRGGVRAWRITTRDGEKMLLARLLPFTSSLIDPLERVELVYQSAWGGYLSIFTVRRSDADAG